MPLDNKRRQIMARRAVFAGIILIYWWLAAAGDWNLFGSEDFGSFYDYQALAFRHGRLNVPPEAVGFEAFVYKDKYYGYWGPFPALLRMPLAFFGRGSWVGHTARFSSFLAACLTLLASAQLASALREWLLPGAKRCRVFETACVAGLALGTTTVFLVAKPFVYHEAILWAGATALLALWWAINYQRSGRPAWLVAATLAAVCSALTRPTLGYGSILGIILMTAAPRLWRQPRNSTITSTIPSRHLFLLIMALGATGIMAPLLYNYARFDTWSPPYRLQMLYTPARLAAIRGGQMFQPGNLPEVFGVYTNPRRLVVQRHFPYFFLDQYWPDARTGVVIDRTEPQAGLLATSTVLALLAVAGIAVALRQRALVALMVGAWATIAVTCIFAYVTERYLQDFLPALALGSLLSAVYISQWRGAPGRAIKYLLLTGMAFSVVENMAFALELQRKSRPLRDPARVAYEDLTAAIDHGTEALREKIWGLPVRPLVVAAWRDLPEHPRAGDLATLQEPFGMLWFDGVTWQKIAGVCDDIFAQRLQVTLPPDGIPRAEPLLSVGKREAANIIFFETDGGPLWAVGCDVWGSPQVWKSKLFKPTGRTMDITILLDRINHRVAIYNGDALLLDARVQPHVFAGLPVNIAKNPFGGSASGPEFHGGINKLPPLPPHD